MRLFDKKEKIISSCLNKKNRLHFCRRFDFLKCKAYYLGRQVKLYGLGAGVPALYVAVYSIDTIL